MLSICSVLFAIALCRALFGPAINRRRWRRFNDDLQTLGFRAATAAEIDHTSRLPVHVLAPSTLAEQRGGGIDHLTVGRVGTQEARAFNVRIRGGGWIDVPAVALRVDASFAHTVIWPLRRGLRPRPGMKRVRFKHRGLQPLDGRLLAGSVLRERHDRRTHDGVARGVFDRTTIELADMWVVAHAISRHGRRAGWVALLELLVAFDGQIPRAVPSLFPERPNQMLWPVRSGRRRTGSAIR